MKTMVAKQSSRPTRAPLPRKALLLVEGDSNVRDSLDSLLSTCGFATETCSSLEAAISKAAANRFDAILLDGQLPELSTDYGADPISPTGFGTPFIIIGGDQNAIQEAFTTEAAGYIPKPFNPTDLLTALVNTL